MEPLRPLEGKPENEIRTCSKEAKGQKEDFQTVAADGATPQRPLAVRPWNHRGKSVIVGLVAILAILGGWIAFGGAPNAWAAASKTSTPIPSVRKATNEHLQAEVLPPGGVVLPAKWGALGKKLVKSGVIDQAKFRQIYAKSGGLTVEENKMLLGENNGDIKMTLKNSRVILNLLWALGLANKNPILEKGPMADPDHGGAQNFASTADWNLAKGNPMNYYSKLNLIPLTASQQALVEKVSKGIYRPCCGNSVFFPDCNHGIAMLGLLELMANQGATENQMYSEALAVNSYWFPQTYMTLAEYFQKKGTAWKDIDARTVLGEKYSSSGGYRAIVKKLSH